MPEFPPQVSIRGTVCAAPTSAEGIYIIHVIANQSQVFISTYMAHNPDETRALSPGNRPSFSFDKARDSAASYKNTHTHITLSIQPSEGESYSAQSGALGPGSS